MIDSKLYFSDNQAITADAVSAFTIDTGVAAPNLGAGSALIIRFIIETSLAVAAGTSTLIIALQHSATDFGGTVQLCQSKDFTQAQLVKGAYIPEMRIPDQHLQFLRLYYLTGTGDFTSGNITAWIDID